MSRVFVDTSGAYALIVVSDANHRRAADAFEGLRSRSAPLVTTSSVLVETYALLASRVGRSAARAFRDNLQPLTEVVWVGRELHERALDDWLGRDREGPSLVDVTSFLTMRDLGIEEAFAYDRHFTQEGFLQAE